MSGTERCQELEVRVQSRRCGCRCRFGSRRCEGTCCCRGCMSMHHLSLLVGQRPAKASIYSLRRVHLTRLDVQHLPCTTSQRIADTCATGLASIRVMWAFPIADNTIRVVKVHARVLFLVQPQIHSEALTIAALASLLVLLPSLGRNP